MAEQLGGIAGKGPCRGRRSRDRRAGRPPPRVRRARLRARATVVPWAPPSSVPDSRRPEASPGGGWGPQGLAAKGQGNPKGGSRAVAGITAEGSGIPEDAPRNATPPAAPPRARAAARCPCRPPSRRPLTRPAAAAAPPPGVKILLAGVDKDSRAAVEAAVRKGLGAQVGSGPWSISVVSFAGKWSVTLDGPGERLRGLSFVATRTGWPRPSATWFGSPDRAARRGAPPGPAEVRESPLRAVRQGMGRGLRVATGRAPGARSGRVPALLEDRPRRGGRLGRRRRRLPGRASLGIRRAVGTAGPAGGRLRLHARRRLRPLAALGAALRGPAPRDRGPAPHGPPLLGVEPAQARGGRGPGDPRARPLPAGASFGPRSRRPVDYLSFIVLLGGAFVISGRDAPEGDLRATPRTNTRSWRLGAVLANFVGTTGASMLLIRPLLRTNSERQHVVHTVVFFIFLVSNIGGCLTPLGDPPLFLGFLRGVPFAWTLRLLRVGVHDGLLSAVYVLWDRRAYAARPGRTASATGYGSGRCAGRGGQPRAAGRACWRRSRFLRAALARAVVVLRPGGLSPAAHDRAGCARPTTSPSTPSSRWRCSSPGSSSP